MAGTAKYQPYPAYQSSGVEWLGYIPEGWEASKIKYETSFQVGWTPPTKTDENFLGSNLWANISDLGAQTITDTAKRISDLAAAKASMSITPSGSLLYSFKLSVGAVSFAGTDMYTNEAIASFLPSSSIPLAYLYYALPIFVIQNASTNIYGARILNQELIRGAVIATPPFATATKIAAFLDYETGKIDALIGKQERLIALLEEKPQAVISHAVTKGLDPTAPLRPSGIDWLGDVPAHWEVKKISWGFKATKGRNGQMLTKEYCGENAGPYPVYSGQTENEGVLGRISWYEFDFGSDGTLFATTVGAKAMNLSHLSGKLSLSQNCMLITPTSPDLLTRFFFYHFQPLFRYERSLIPDHMQASFRMEDLYQYRHAVLPVSEQQEIVNFLDAQTERFAVLISKAQSAIALLKERRTALISAAVTGKIDLRGWEAPSGATVGIQDKEVLA